MLAQEFATNPRYTIAKTKRASHEVQYSGEDADRFRTLHLAESLTFLPYGVAVDHFQHFVYANPDATPSERLDERGGIR